MIGNAEAVPEQEIAGVRENYLTRHENSRYWVDFSDFDFFQLPPIDIYYVGGFGVMGWVEAKDYEQAAPDPLATMTSVDRLSFSLRLKTFEGMKGVRINFPYAVETTKETRTVLVEMVRQARIGD